MLIRSALTLLAAATGAAALSAPVQAHEILSAPPAYAQPGACYAHVRRPAMYAPPPGPRGAWRLTPPGPGQPGPSWCFVTEPGGPPVLLDPGVDGWMRVACPHRPAIVRHARRPRPHVRVRRHVRCGCHPVHPRPHPRPHWRPAPTPCCLAPPPAPCCLRPTSPPPPPVVVLRPYNPAAHYGEPGVRALSWPGKG